MKNTAIYFLIFVSLIFFSGCPKLVRAKKKEDTSPIHTFDNDAVFDKLELNYDVFKKNYIYWKTAHDELYDNIDLHKKKRQACFIYILDYIERMKSTFPEDKKYLFEETLNEYKSQSYLIEADTISNSTQEVLRKRLNKIRKKTVKKFSYQTKFIKEFFGQKDK